MSIIKVNKPEAARRQVDCAIELLFQEKDAVSIHTLASAGGRILRDLCEKNPDCKFYREFLSAIKPESRNDYWNSINRAANFFKHADKDPNGVLNDVEEEVNELILLISSHFYLDLGFSATTQMRVLAGWMTMSYPDMINLKNLLPHEREIILSTFNQMPDFHLKPRNFRIKVGYEFLKNNLL